MQFPKWKYHKDGREKIVHDQPAEDNLGEGWHDTPRAAGLVENDTFIPAKDEPKATPPEDQSARISELEAALSANAEAHGEQLAEAKAYVEKLEAEKTELADTLAQTEAALEAANDEIETLKAAASAPGEGPGDTPPADAPATGKNGSKAKK